MFEGDSADTCAGNFSLMSMGAERRVSHAQTRRRGPPSAPAEISFILIFVLIFQSPGSSNDFQHVSFFHIFFYFVRDVGYVVDSILNDFSRIDLKVQLWLILTADD